MRRPWLEVAALVCLLATAGCLGFLADGTSPSTSTPAPSTPELSRATVTPTASPVQSMPTRSPEPGDPWTESPGQSADLHNATMQNTSFTARYYRVYRTDGIVTLRASGVVRYDGNRTVYYNYTVVSRERGMPSRRHVEIWSNGRTGWRALTNANETIVNATRPIRTAPTFADRLEAYLRLLRTDVSGYSRVTGEPIVRVSGSVLNRSGEQSSGPVARIGIGEIRTGEFSAELADDAVRRYRVEFVGSDSERSRGGESTVFREEVVFTEVGTTTISRPAWVTTTNESRSG